MNDWITITLIIFAEFALVEFFYILYLFRKKASGHNVDLEKARQVYLELTQDSRRKEKLIPELENLYEVEQDKREEVAEKIIQCENTLYRGIIKAIATGDLDIKGMLSNQDSNVNAEFQNLTQQLKEKKQEIIDAIKEEVREITNDRDQLRDELKSTLEAMDRTLNEYANMYSVKTKEQEEEFMELKQTVDNVTQHANYTIKKSGRISSVVDQENDRSGQKKKKTAGGSKPGEEPELKEIDTQRINTGAAEPARQTPETDSPAEEPAVSEAGTGTGTGAATDAKTGSETDTTAPPAEESADKAGDDVDVDAALEGFDLGDTDDNADKMTVDDGIQVNGDTAYEAEQKVKEA